MAPPNFTTTRYMRICILLMLLDISYVKAGTWINLDPPGAVDFEIKSIDGDNVVGSYSSIEVVPNKGKFVYKHGFSYHIPTHKWSKIDAPGEWSISKFTELDMVNGNYVFGNCESGRFAYNVASNKWDYINVNINRHNFSNNKYIGTYRDANLVEHGFICDLSTNKRTLLDMPGARSGSTYPIMIFDNNIFGTYNDGDHFFLCNMATQTCATIDIPGVKHGHGFANDTFDSKIVGIYVDDSLSETHGYLLDIKTQKWTILDKPDAKAGTTDIKYIQGNKIAGTYSDNNGEHFFCYDIVTQKWTSFDKPKAGTCSLIKLNDNNVCIRYNGVNNPRHGFVYNMATQTWIDIDIPGAIETDTVDSDGNYVIGRYITNNPPEHIFLYKAIE